MARKDFNMSKKLILFCGCCKSKVIADDIRQRVRAALQQSELEYIEYPDLCELAAKKDTALQERLNEASELIIVACYPRSVTWILNAGSAPLDNINVKFLNMREQSAEKIISALGCKEAQVDSVPDDNQTTGWIPWFPVIDYDRCINCGQCLDFCLFGVYERDAENKVVVANPQNCKNNCPACARICPKVAIIFPKLPEAPINGAEVDDEKLDGSKVALDIDEIVGDDLYTALAARQKRARSALLKRKSEEKALDEREKCKVENESTVSEASFGEKNQPLVDTESDDLDSLSDAELQKVACEACAVDCGSNPNVKD